jgi:prolyl-tRNA synthetase
MQTSLLETARDERERRTLRDPSSYDEMIEYLRDAGGFVAAPWCGRRECEGRVKDESSATIRCLPLAEQPARAGTCVCCGRTAVAAAVWAQAY